MIEEVFNRRTLLFILVKDFLYKVIEFLSPFSFWLEPMERFFQNFVVKCTLISFLEMRWFTLGQFNAEDAKAPYIDRYAICLLRVE
jgi:hypothetical protein